jgi:hypothetical protein
MEPDQTDATWLKATQLALLDFDFEFVEEFSHILTGDDQFFGQAHGRGAGNLALRGRGLNFCYKFFSAHVPALLG